ncbi:MFS transporter [Inquilinus sp. NPDC058860]|uniref:MFS transporter n=1 Tax=Inquilinus sp. NPDC058860 TaxID=3346652 RepID=UPI0036CBF070
MAMSGVTRLTVVLLLATTADQFMLIALLWFVLEDSNAPAMAAMVVLVHQVPAIVAGPLAGRLLDRYGAAKLMTADNLARALVLAVVPLLHWAGSLDLVVVFLCVATAGAFSPFTYVGSRALLPSMARGRNLAVANGLLSVGDQLPYIFGPALGGALAAALGGAAAVAVPVACLLIAALLAAGLPALDHSRGQSSDAPMEDGAGWLGFRPLLSDPALRVLLALSIVYYFAYGPLEPALAVFVRDRLGSGAAGFGLLWTAFGIGAVAGLLLVKALSRRGPGLMNALSVVAFGLATAPLALVHSMPAAIVCMALGGIAWGPYVALEASVIQRRGAGAPPCRSLRRAACHSLDGRSARGGGRWAHAEGTVARDGHRCERRRLCPRRTFLPAHAGPACGPGSGRRCDSGGRGGQGPPPSWADAARSPSSARGEPPVFLELQGVGVNRMRERNLEPDSRVPRDLSFEVKMDHNLCYFASRI